MASSFLCTKSGCEVNRLHIYGKKTPYLLAVSVLNGCPSPYDDRGKQSRRRHVNEANCWLTNSVCGDSNPSPIYSGFTFWSNGDETTD